MFENDTVFTTTGAAHKIKWLNRRYHLMIEPVKELFKNATVLDLGCHNGRWIYVSILLGANHVIGIDCNPRWLKEAEINLKDAGLNNFELRRSNLDNIKAIDYNPTIVLCMGTLYHLDEPFIHLSKIARMEPILAIIDTFHSRGQMKSEKHLDHYLQTIFNVKKLKRYGKKRVCYHCTPMESKVE